MEYFLCLVILKLIYIPQSLAYICLTWTLLDNALRLKCQTSNIRAKISFFYPQNQEQGYCDIPYPTPQCINNEYYPNSTISQNVILKETVFEIKDNLGINVIGKWSCHHGKRLEVASSDVQTFNKIDFAKSIYVRLSGPSYVKTKKPVWLTCVSNVQLKTKTVQFYLNDILHTTLKADQYGCYSSAHSGLCLTDECQCSTDGNTYIIKHHGFQNGGIYSVKCTFEFELAMRMSDCILINVINMVGPSITHSKPLPFLAFDYVELLCTVFINGTNIQLKWECFDLKSGYSFRNETAVDTALSFQAISSMNENTCTCKAKIKNFETATSMTIQVTTAPILAINQYMVCNESTGITVSCLGSGELPVDGFRAWVHYYNGQLIRYLKGIRNGNTLTINLNCNYENEGDYVCEAWTNNQGIKKFNNVTEKVIVQGPPQITERYVKNDHEKFEFSIHLYSIPSSINIQWFEDIKKLENTTQYLQTVDLIPTHRRMYGTVITTNGYSVKLTVKTYSADQKKQTYSVFVKNSIGNVTEMFITDGKEKIFQAAFNLRDVIIVSGSLLLVTIIVVLIIFFLRSGKFNIGRAGNMEMYQAAGPSEPIVHVYDIPAHYEEVMSIPNETFGTDQTNDPNVANKLNTNDPDDLYEVPHEYMEVT